MKMFSKWFQFVGERFSPISYAMMILVFFGAHYILFVDLIDGGVSAETDLFLQLPIVIVLFCFFFSLRLFDEVKDFKTDVKYYPERPLPRGSITKKEALNAVLLMIAIELILLSFYGPWPLFCGVCVTAYTLLMYKEFFISKWLRARLTTYAVMHTFVLVLMSITIFTAMLDVSLREIPVNLFWFALANWLIFSLFEFGRKTFVSNEERMGIDSYSKIFGKHGAVLLILFTSTAGVFLLGQVLSQFGFRILSASLLFLALFGFLYAMQNSYLLAKTFRFLTTSYIVFVYGVIIVT